MNKTKRQPRDKVDSSCTWIENTLFFYGIMPVNHGMLHNLSQRYDSVTTSQLHGCVFFFFSLWSLFFFPNDHIFYWSVTVQEWDTPGWGLLLPWTFVTIRRRCGSAAFHCWFYCSPPERFQQGMFACRDMPAIVDIPPALQYLSVFFHEEEKRFNFGVDFHG